MIKTPLRGRKNPLKFASLPTCGFVAQLVERPTSIWEAWVQAPSKPEFFSGFFFCNFFNCSLPARINWLPTGSLVFKCIYLTISTITLICCIIQQAEIAALVALKEKDPDPAADKSSESDSSDSEVVSFLSFLSWEH